MPRYKYLIIGGGMAADAAVRGIREVEPTERSVLSRPSLTHHTTVPRSRRGERPVLIVDWSDMDEWASFSMRAFGTD